MSVSNMRTSVYKMPNFSGINSVRGDPNVCAEVPERRLVGSKRPFRNEAVLCAPQRY